MPHRIGDWNLHEPIGRGRQVSVWRASHAHRPLEAALKVAHAPIGRDLPTTMARIAAHAALDHPGIERLVDTGSVPLDGVAHLWTAFELLPGGTLADRADDLDWETTADLLEQLLHALAYAHASGTVHRDVKPENVLFRSRLGWEAVLSDFGLAWRRRPRSEEPGSGATPAFAPPEQSVGSATAQGPYTDLYAVGALAWWCLTGRPPFGDADARAVTWAHRHSPLPDLVPRFTVPPEAVPWVRRLLRKDPHARGALPDVLAALQRLRGRDPSIPSYADWVSHPRPAWTAGLVGVAPTPLVGRTALLDRLAGRLGTGRTHRIVAPADTGRQAFVAQLGRYLFATGLAMPVGLSARAEPFEHALAHWLRVDLPSDDPALALRQRLQAFGLNTPIDVALYTEAAESLRARRGCRGARALLRRLWRSAGYERPLLLMTDGPAPEVRRFCESLLADGEAGLHLELATEGSGPDTTRLRPLSVRDRERLLDAMAPLSPALRSTLAGASTGWPTEVARHLARALPTLEWSRDRLGAQGDPSSATLPGIAPHLRVGLGVAALMTPFRAPLWRVALESLGVDAPEGVFAALQRRGTFTFTPSGFVLADPAVRASALEGVPPEALQAWHRALALAGARHPIDAGRHLLAAGDREGALDRWVRAPWAPGRPAEIVHGARLALEVLDDDDPRVGQCLAAIAVASSGDTSAFGAATEALCDWLARTNDPTWAAHGPFLRGWACLFDGRLDEAREHLHASLAHGPGAPLYGHVHRALGEVAVQQGRLDEAVAHGTHAVQSAHPSESQLARLDLAWALGAASRIPEAREVLASAEPLLQPSHRPTAFQVRGDLDRWAGALDDATVAYAEAQRWASHLGLSQSAHRTNRLLLDHERGDPGLPDALSAVLDEPAAWIQGPLRALAVRATVSTGGVLFERALTGLESDGLVWDPDAVRLLREARRHGTSAQAARIGAVLGPWDR